MAMIWVKVAFGELKVGDEFKDQPSYFSRMRKTAGNIASSIRYPGAKLTRGTRTLYSADAEVYVEREEACRVR